MDYKQTNMWKEIQGVPDVFADMYGANVDTISTLIKTIKDSKIKNFVVAARGASKDAVVFFKYMLEIYTSYTVGLSAPSVITLYRGKIDYSNSIIIGCSAKGNSEDVLEVLKKGNEQGAITIGITNAPDSPIGKEAKFTLLCKAGEENSAFAIKSYHSELYLLLWLASGLAGLKYNIFSLKTLRDEIIHVMPQIDALTTLYAQKYKDIKAGFVVSRGLTYTVALETALLLQKTGYINVKGYAGSNFILGPNQMITKDTPVIMFCAKNHGDEELQAMVRADQIKTIEKISTLGAPMLLITNDCVLTGKFNRCQDALINFSTSEEISVFAFTLFGQMLACKISCLVGNNPDKPRPIDLDVEIE